MASRSAKMKKTKINMYNAKGAPEEGEAMDTTPGFKKGGKTVKRKAGGMVEGEKEKHRADKKPRHKRASGGRTPYSSGSQTSMPAEAGKTNRGHEGERPGE